MAVRLSLDPTSGACHSAHAELEILLPIPAVLESSLTAAQARKQVFLAESARKLSAGKTTLFSFETAESEEIRKR